MKKNLKKFPARRGAMRMWEAEEGGIGFEIRRGQKRIAISLDLIMVVALTKNLYLFLEAQKSGEEKRRNSGK